MSTLQPGATARFHVDIPEKVSLNELRSARVRVTFLCGICARCHAREVELCGELITVDCECGEKLQLQVNPVWGEED